MYLGIADDIFPYSFWLICLPLFNNVVCIVPGIAELHAILSNIHLCLIAKSRVSLSQERKKSVQGLE